MSAQIGGGRKSQDSTGSATLAEQQETNAQLEDANVSLEDLNETSELILAKLTATGATEALIQSNTLTTNAHLAYIEGTQDATNTKLDAANAHLANIESNGIAVNVNTDTLESLSTIGNNNTAGIRTDLATQLSKLEQIRAAIAGTLNVTGSVSVTNFPATQAISAAALPLPTGAATDTAVVQLHTDNGNEGSAPPALNGVGAFGILGYLRNQLDKLQTIATAVTGTLGVKNAAQQSVTNTIATPAASSSPIIDWTPVAGSSFLLQLRLSGAAAGGSIQVLWSDDGVNLITNAMVYRQITNPTSMVASVSSFAAATLSTPYQFQVLGAYFKIVVSNTAFTGVGTVQVTATFLNSDLFSASTGAQVVDTELATAASASDSFGNPITAPVISINHGFNGTFWERLRTQSGGVLKTSLSGNTPTVTTFVATTSTQIKAAATDRKELIIENGSNVVLYILFGAGTASATNRTMAIQPGGIHIEDRYAGAVQAVFASTPTGQANITDVLS